MKINENSRLTAAGTAFRHFYAKSGMFLILAVMLIIISSLTPNFLRMTNLLNLVRQVSFTAIIGCGLTFILISKNMDLSAGGIVSLTSVVTALFAHPGEYPLIVCVILGLCVGIICGFVNGVIVANFAIPPFIVTLGMKEVASGMALRFSNACPIPDLHEEIRWLGAGKLFDVIPVPCVILLIVVAITWVMLSKTKFGRHVLAVGGNETAAVISGINVKMVKIKAYVLVGFLASLSAIVLTGRNSSGQPNLGNGMEFDAIASVIIGGTSMSGGVGTIWGTVIGALIIGVINNGMNLMNVNVYYQQIAKGIVMVLAVLLDCLKNKRATRG